MKRVHSYLQLAPLLLLAASASALAAPQSFTADQTPCPGERCREVCTYTGSATGSASGFSADGDLKITTIFDNRDGHASFRLLLEADIDAAVVGMKIYLDETTHFDPKTTRMMEVDRFLAQKLSYLGTRSIKRPRWTKTRFYWPDIDHVARSYSEQHRITGKSVEKMESQWQPFANRYLGDANFGKDWSGEFDAAKPFLQEDEKLQDLPTTLQSGFFAPFYHLRFAPNASSLDYDIFVSGKSSEGILETSFGAKGTQNNRARWITGTVAFDKYRTEKDHPAAFLIDPVSRQLLKLDLRIVGEDGEAIAASGELQKCQVSR